MSGNDGHGESAARQPPDQVLVVSQCLLLNRFHLTSEISSADLQDIAKYVHEYKVLYINAQMLPASIKPDIALD